MRVLLEALPGDAVSHCVHAHACPGCPWLGREYEAQVEAKTARVLRAVSGFDDLLGVRVQPTQRAPRRFNYRVRAKLVADASGALGLFERGTHDVVDLPECRVLDPLVAEAARVLRGALKSQPVLDGADIARVDDALMITLIARQGAAHEALRSVAKTLREACPSVLSLAISRRSHGAVQLLGGDVERVFGPGELPRRVLPDGPYHYATFGAFVQAHSDVAREIYGRIAERVLELGPKPRVLELYAGSGALSLELSARGAQVVSVEAFGPACELLGRAAREQRLDVEVRHGDAGAEALRALARGERFDAVLVNPPRRGLDVDVRRAIAQLGPSHVAYVSCHPPTLARDLSHLAQEGLAAEQLSPFDMMPWTDHVETLAWLSQEAVPAPRVLFAHDDFVAVNKGPHEPTTPQGEHVRSLLERVRGIQGFEQAHPVHRLDVGTSGVCLFARTAEHVAELSRALSEGEKTYLALAQGIVRGHGSIRRPIVEQGKSLEASTRYRRSEVVAGHSLLRVALETGRKHQIRRHFAGIGHPLVGDTRYGERRTNVHFAMRHGLDRPFLHCERIVIGYREQRFDIAAPPPADLTLVLDSMRAERESSPAPANDHVARSARGR